jgi:hypothetical protein
MPRLLLPWSCIVLFAACERGDPALESSRIGSFSVVIEARAQGREVVPNVEVLSGTERLGRTDERGRVTLALGGEEGARTSLSVRCPPGFASPERPLVVGLRHLQAGSEPPRFEVACVRLVHSVLVGIQVENGAHLPVLHLQKKVGETDEHGILHVLLTAENDERFTLIVDTSTNPSLRPQNPSLSFVTRDDDEFVLLEQKFAVQRSAPVQRVRRRGPRPL